MVGSNSRGVPPSAVPPSPYDYSSRSNSWESKFMLKIRNLFIACCRFDLRLSSNNPHQPQVPGLDKPLTKAIHVNLAHSQEQRCTPLHRVTINNPGKSVTPSQNSLRALVVPANLQGILSRFSLLCVHRLAQLMGAPISLAPLPSRNRTNRSIRRGDR